MKKMFPLTKNQKIRIISLLSILCITIMSLYLWTHRTIVIEDVVIYKSMCRTGFSQKTVAILPIGDNNIEEIKYLKSLFVTLYQVKVEILESVAIPPEAFIEKKGQYDLSILNNYLSSLKKNSSYFRLLGIIDKDTTAGDHDYLLGMASLIKEVATIATTRLRENYYDRKENPLLFRERFFKLTLHEYAHTFGLFHCDANCLMQFTPEIAKFDAKPAGLCWICQRRIIPE